MQRYIQQPGVASEVPMYFAGCRREYGEVSDGSEESISMDNSRKGPPLKSHTTCQRQTFRAPSKRGIYVVGVRVNIRETSIFEAT
jgi:hypothetical protein